MLKILDLPNSNVIASVVEGNLTADDLDKIYPLIKDKVKKGQKIRWYFEMVNFKGWEMKGFWKDLKMDVFHVDDYERIAMVGDKKWQEWMTQFMKPFTSTEVRYFDLLKKDEARDWIME